MIYDPETGLYSGGSGLGGSSRFDALVDVVNLDVNPTGFAKRSGGLVSLTSPVTGDISGLDVTLSTSFLPLADGVTIDTDSGTGNAFSVTIAGNRTMNAPTNVRGDGQKLIYRITQDEIGSRTITWDAAFRFPGGVPPTLTATAAKTDYIGFIYISADSKWDQVAERMNL